MADELTVTVAVKYSDSEGTDFPNFGVADLSMDVATLTPKRKKVSVTTTEGAIDLDGVTAAGALIVGVNRDATNYIEIRSATGASNDIVKVLAGEPFCFRFGSDVTAPFWIANSAACKVDYELFPA